MKNPSTAETSTRMEVSGADVEEVLRIMDVMETSWSEKNLPEQTFISGTSGNGSFIITMVPCPTREPAGCKIIPGEGGI